MIPDDFVTPFFFRRVTRNVVICETGQVHASNTIGYHQLEDDIVFFRASHVKTASRPELIDGPNLSSLCTAGSENGYLAPAPFGRTQIANATD
jgi:hypothetical protein